MHDHSEIHLLLLFETRQPVGAEVLIITPGKAL